MDLPQPVVDDCLDLLFAGLEAQDVQRWWSQGFTFDEKVAKFGLLQRHGGPCGVLAVIQAHMVCRLIFGCELGEFDKPAEGPKFDCVPAPTEGDLQCALGAAIATVVWACSAPDAAGLRSATLVLLDPSCDPVAAGIRPARFVSTTAECYEDLEGLVVSSLPSFATPAGVMLVVLSCLLSRGLDRVRADPDEPGMSLVGRFGHSSTELLNLVLTGEATSGVFDGEQKLGEGQDSLSLRGVRRRPLVGFLSHAEALRYLAVGSLLKTPRLPVWIVASESHFTVLWGDSMACLEESPSTRAHAAFRVYDKEGAGMIMGSDLGRLLTDLGLADKVDKAWRDKVGSTDIVLWSELWPKLGPLMGLQQSVASDPVAAAATVTAAGQGASSSASAPAPATASTSNAAAAMDPEVVTGVLTSLLCDSPFAVADGGAVHVEAVPGILDSLGSLIGLQAITGMTMRSPLVEGLPRCSASPDAVLSSLPSAAEYVSALALGQAVDRLVRTGTGAVDGTRKRPRSDSEYARQLAAGGGDDDASSVVAVSGEGEYDGMPALEAPGASAGPQAYGPFTAARTFDLWHYNGLVDGGRQPVLCHLTVRQTDSGLLPGGTARDTADALAMQQQWAVGGGIEEQTAAAIAMSTLGTGSAGSAGSASSSKSTAALEGILRTRWPGLAVQLVHGAAPSLD